MLIKIRYPNIVTVVVSFFHMALSHNDWGLPRFATSFWEKTLGTRLPNSHIWLAEIEIESGLDFHT